MIDIENELFTEIANAVRAEYPAYVSSVYVRKPPHFPAVSIIEMDNTVRRDTQDSGLIEGYADVMYEVNVYVNERVGAKAAARAIMGFIDGEFAKRGFTRSFMNPIPNMDDATIYRITARYRATASQGKIIYRR